MATNVSTRALKLLGRSLALACLFTVGRSASYGSDELLVSQGAYVGDVQPTGLREDRRTPAYWGLKAGSYIPEAGCWGGNFKASRNHNKFDYEICTKVKFEGADAWVY